jgi:hypothetical protein
MDERLETPKQLADRVGISKRKIDTLIRNRQIEYIEIGCRKFIPNGAFGRMIASRKVEPWAGETKDRASIGTVTDAPGTSSGQSTAAAMSARLARQTAKKLKTSSRSGCSGADAELAQVIRLRSS